MVHPVANELKRAKFEARSSVNDYPKAFLSIIGEYDSFELDGTS